MGPAFTSGARLCLICLFVFAAFGGIGTRLYMLHVVEAEELAGIIEHNRRQVVEQPARRGNILDSRGNVLATSRSEVVLGVDPQLVVEEDRPKWAALAKIIGLELSELEELMLARTRPGPSGYAGDVQLVRWRKLAEGLSEQEYEQILDLDIDGVYGNRRFTRFYPGNETAAHVIGYINRESTPVTGIELFMDFYLRGQDGWLESERDGRRRELVQFRDRVVEPSDGLDVELTLDLVVQHMVEEEVRRLVEEHAPKGVSILVSEPWTGYILALANYPTYDLNRYNTEPIAHQRNRALTDVLEPGSTFKIVPVAAALEEGLVTPHDVFDCSISRIQIGNRWAALPNDHKPYRELTVAGIVAKSSNVGVAQLGVLMGAETLHRYAAQFGFGVETGFPTGGEVAGVLHEVADWDGLTITRLPMGHAVSATPMQIHASMGAIANRGVLMRPRVVRRAIDASGQTVVSFAPEPRWRVVSEEVSRTVAALLVNVVGPEGTARQAEIPGYEVAGKTGTTRKIINGRYSNRHHIASFSGFFPASNPRLVITVIVDEPSGAHSYGGLVAAPAFKRIADQLIQYLGIPPVERKAEPYLAYEERSYDSARTGL